MAADTGDDAATKFHVVSPVGPLYRIARVPDPWAWPDWANVGTDGTFGNRWDDPQGLYRVVYDRSTSEGQRRFVGIAYRSRMGDEFQNWAFFESSSGTSAWQRESQNQRIDDDDPDLLRTLELLRVRLIAPG